MDNIKGSNRNRPTPLVEPVNGEQISEDVTLYSPGNVEDNLSTQVSSQPIFSQPFSLPPLSSEPLSSQPISAPSASSSQSIASQLWPYADTKPANYGNTVRVGSVLKGRFIIDKEIARGGMGVIYRARDNLKEQFQDRNPYLAIKVLGERCKEHPDFLVALQREAGKVQKLAHPNIVTVYDFDSDGDNVFMTMEYLEGETLQHFLARHKSKRVPLTDALTLIQAMGEGLAYAHKKGIVHCDFKPGNVFLCNDASVKILDFGIARANRGPGEIHQDTTRFDAGSLGALTPTYASCELIEDEPPDQRDDIYGLACVAYELLSGHHPFNRLPATVARDSHLKPARIKGLNKQQRKALLRGLAFQRSARTASVTEFLVGLNGPQKTSVLSYGRQIFFGVTLLALLVVGVTVAFQLYNKPITAKPETSINLLPPLPSSPVELSTEQQKIVARLLEAAEIHFMVKRITEPVGSNAYEAYLHVLEIDPSNADARQGIKQIADYYENLAQESLPKGDTVSTLSIINTGLTVMPQHPGLVKLKEQIDTKFTSSKLFDWLKTLWP